MNTYNFYILSFYLISFKTNNVLTDWQTASRANSSQGRKFIVGRFTILFTLSNAKHGYGIIIGLEASAASKGPQVKTTEPMVSIKVTYCSIVWIFACDGFAKNYMGSRPEAKKCDFFIYSVRMIKWMYAGFLFFRLWFFPHRSTDWNEIIYIMCVWSLRRILN